MSKTPARTFAESNRTFYEMTGPLPTAEEEQRRYPRFCYRSCAEAIVYPLCAGQDPTPAQCFLVTRDLSRGGLSLIHNQPLSAGQRVDVILNGEAPRPLEVVWCCPWIDQRYLIGCRFVRRAVDASSAGVLPPVSTEG